LTNRVKQFTPLSICLIIESAAKNGVAALKFGDLEINFSPKAVEEGHSADIDLPKHLEPIHATHASEQTLRIDDTLETVDKELLEDMRVTQLMFDDPLAFESEMIDKQLSEGHNHGTVLNQ
jgi:hypothetical protein